MTYFLLAWALIATVAAVGCGLAARFYADKLHYVRSMHSQGDEVTQQFYRAQLRRADSDVAYLREQHAKEIERLNTTHQSALDRVLNMTSFGTPTPKEAVVTAPEPDAESRLLRGINEDMINVGAARLDAEYRARGITVPLDELRDEAHSMLLGVSYVPKDRTLNVARD